MNPTLSIIIPCYKSEATLPETLASVLAQDFESWEAIIVNDGSPDQLEEVAMGWVSKDTRFRYFKKENGGLGSARNFGIQKAQGKYILPLDSDNNIKTFFPKKAIQLMEASTEYDIVYGNASYFGAKSGIWKMGAFNKFKLLSFNYIDACAVVRKNVFDELGGYEENLPYQGHEDWEFWIKCIGGEKKFYYLDKVVFEYRVLPSSMIRNFDESMDQENENYIKQKHAHLYLENFKPLFWQYQKWKHKSEKSFLTSLKGSIKKLIKF